MRLTSPYRISAARTLALLTLFLVPLWLQAEQATQQPIKSPADDNAYRYISLDNGLEALLVSDPDADKAAASLNVAVGSGNDPGNREGMAHFLEHLLFLGTEKYPDPGEYQQFIRSHGGSHNAFTAFQDTNYFFDIRPGYLEPALDRFAQQFSAPLFTPELVDRERNAVHSEFSASLKDDGRRFYSVRKAVSNPEHAFSQFSVGNLSTLENTEDRPLREDLIEFWKQEYSADLMTLVVYGPQSLDELEAMVRPRFSAIENRELSVMEHPEPLFAPGTLPARVQAETLRDIRRLHLIFPIPSQQDNYRNKPLHYVAGLLGHEGPGSLFDLLKNRGWVESLSAGGGTDDGTDATLEISMELTGEGLKHEEEIVALAFDYIDLIRERGIERFRFEEQEQLAEIDFRYQQRPDPLHHVMRLSMQMQEVAPKDVLQAPWMMADYVPDQYRQLLQRLTPDNVLIAVQSPEDLPESASETRWYDTPYLFSTQIEVSDGNATTRELAEQLALPEPNPFIPEDLAMVAGDSMEKPERLAEFDNLTVWYARDTRFERPEANIYLSLRTPATHGSARGQVLTQLLSDAVSEQLNPWAYPAMVAGLDYRVYPHLRGLTLRAGGYHDRLPVLLNRIMATLADPVITEQRFRIARRQLADSLRNSLRDRPVAQASSLVQNALIEGSWTIRERLEALESVTLVDLQDFARGFAREAEAVMLVHGNATPALALNTARQAQAVLLYGSIPIAVPRSQVRDVPQGETRVTLNVDHPDTGYLRYSQGPGTGFDDRATYRLLTQIVSGPFYEDIRTTRQLGYVVHASPFEMLETPAIGLIVQSPKADAEAIDAAVNEFAKGFRPQIEEFSDKDLQREQQAVISQVLEKERRLSEVSERYWREIDQQAFEFDSRQKLAEALRQVTRADLLSAFDAALLDHTNSLLVVTGADKETSSEIIDGLRRQPAVGD
ncbi:Secreted Zn-dependent peptidases, insulinase-like [Marinobacter daqiaonensis]|uniref:Protease 3 n=1 Tax=Marinobacter daqiaonensis TaxID=650891 RepID=A0A1I6JHJ5_9GAMM|nr:insulinase family protein [Marinobacter daqiaonensis]SFR78477.1 Secreted Zn-dependent peptidases, insulinase-like [Marinobacter daqiaonensis]